jgi:hypothetical protein
VSDLHFLFPLFKAAYLQTPDDLVATLLGHLPLEVLPSTGLILLLLPAGVLLGVVVDVGINALLQGVGASAGTGAGINTGRTALLLVTGSGVGEILRIA